jgi:hypothetical protein
LKDLYRTVPGLTVPMYWQPGLPSCQQFGFDPDQDPKWRSGTVANTSANRALTIFAHLFSAISGIQSHMLPQCTYWLSL